MRRRRLRRPLMALIVLIVALAIGYGIRACDSRNAQSGLGEHLRFPTALAQDFAPGWAGGADKAYEHPGAAHWTGALRTPAR